MKYIKPFQHWKTIKEEVGIDLKHQTKPINYIKKNIEIRMDIEASRHALERQYRHGVDIQRNNQATPKITEDDISETVEKSIELLTIRLMQGEFNIDDRFVITDKENNLNLVCKLSPGETYFTLTVITVMVKKNFDPQGSYQIII